jgi:hypothetical protein
VAALVVAWLALAPAPAGASVRVPRGFLGANVDGPMLEAGFPLDREVGRMVRSGVETVRVAVYWDAAQPYPSLKAAPPSRAARGHSRATSRRTGDRRTASSARSHAGAFASWRPFCARRRGRREPR